MMNLQCERVTFASGEVGALCTSAKTILQEFTDNTRSHSKIQITTSMTRRRSSGGEVCHIKFNMFRDNRTSVGPCAQL